MMMLSPHVASYFLLSNLLLGGLFLFPFTTSASKICTTKQHEQDHPVLCQMLEHIENNPNEMAAHIYQHALENNLLVGHDWVTTTPSSETKLSKVVDVSTETETSPQRRQQRLLRSKQQANTQQRAVNENNKKDQQLPIVFAHGMGDSCFNSGMDHITKKTGDMLGVYSVCIPTGKDQAEDTNNGYALNMDASVDVFAAAVLNNTQLQQGFHAIGFSQGNNVIRGYIAKYNTGNAVVHSFLSINGVNAGEGAVPHCDPSSLKRSESETTTTKIRFDICELLMESASRAAYTEFAQEHVFQANYWRDPRPSAFPRYQKYAQLAKWNNEAGFINETLKENWAKTSTFVWVLATQDSMVFPREGEHWQAPDPNDPYHSVLPMKETEWYKQDLFGLRTADEAGKNYFETFEGDHLAFSEEDFTRWINTYLVGGMHEWMDDY